MDIHTFQKLKRRRRRKFRRSFSVSWCKLWLLVSRLDSVFQLDQIKHHLMDAPLRCIFLVSVIPIRTKSQIFKQTSFFPRQRIQHSQPSRHGWPTEVWKESEVSPFSFSAQPRGGWVNVYISSPCAVWQCSFHPHLQMWTTRLGSTPLQTQMAVDAWRTICLLLYNLTTVQKKQTFLCCWCVLCHTCKM